MQYLSDVLALSRVPVQERRLERGNVFKLYGHEMRTDLIEPVARRVAITDTPAAPDHPHSSQSDAQSREARSPEPAAANRRGCAPSPGSIPERCRSHPESPRCPQHCAACAGDLDKGQATTRRVARRRDAVDRAWDDRESQR